MWVSVAVRCFHELLSISVRLNYHFLDCGMASLAQRRPGGNVLYVRHAETVSFLFSYNYNSSFQCRLALHACWPYEKTKSETCLERFDKRPQQSANAFTTVEQFNKSHDTEQSEKVDFDDSRTVQLRHTNSKWACVDWLHSTNYQCVYLLIYVRHLRLFTFTKKKQTKNIHQELKLLHGRYLTLVPRCARRYLNRLFVTFTESFVQCFLFLFFSSLLENFVRSLLAVNLVHSHGCFLSNTYRQKSTLTCK